MDLINISVSIIFLLVFPIMLNSLIRNRNPHILILSIIVLFPFGGIEPLIFGQTPKLYISQMVAIIVVIFFLIRISLGKDRKNYRAIFEFHRDKLILKRLVFIFMCLSLPSIFLTEEFTRSIYIISDRILVLLVVIAILHFGSEPKHRYLLLWSVTIYGTTVACIYLFSAVQVYETTDIELLSYGLGEKSELVKAGMLGLSNTVAYILGFTIIISITLFLLGSLSTKHKMTLIILITIQIITMISTVSRGGLIALMLTLFLSIFFIVKLRFSQKVLLLIVLVVVTFSLYFMTKTFLAGISHRYYSVFSPEYLELSIYQRLRLFEYSLQDFLDNPIFGIGIGNVVHANRPTNFSGMTHNLFIQTLAEEGIIVFLSFCSLLFFILRRFFKLNRLYPNRSQAFVTMAFILPLIHAMVEPGFWAPVIAYMYWISVAVLISGPVSYFDLRN